MARRQAATRGAGTGFGEGVITLPPELVQALTTGGRGLAWTEAERAVLRAAYPMASQHGSVRLLAERWHTLGNGFPDRSATQLRNQACLMDLQRHRMTT